MYTPRSNPHRCMQPPCRAPSLLAPHNQAVQAVQYIFSSALKLRDIKKIRPNQMSVHTHNPIHCFFACARVFANGIKYISKYLHSLLGITCGIEILEISLYHVLKPIRGPSEDLVLRVSLCPDRTTRCNLRVRSSPYQSQYWVRRDPVLVRVIPQHVHSHLASDTSSQAPR